MSLSRNLYISYSHDGLLRLLSLSCRDPFHPAYGSGHRDYWLYKTSDFDDAVRLFSANAYSSALSITEFSAYTNQLISALRATVLRWTTIQHSDGSLDEFYPYERGWVGPTAFTLYSVASAYINHKQYFSPTESINIESSIRLAASYVARGDYEGDSLGNHHAMAYLSLVTCLPVFDTNSLKLSIKEAKRRLFTYFVPQDNYLIEYDGIDPGYLSASCSFLAKTLSLCPDLDISDLIYLSARTCAHFCYPDGRYSGTIGSRNTMHFYPYAFEYLADAEPLFSNLAQFSRFHLTSNNAITPNIMSDRYLPYRVEEYLSTFHVSKPSLPNYSHADLHPITHSFAESSQHLYISDSHFLLNIVAPNGPSLELYNLSDCQLQASISGFRIYFADGTVLTTQASSTISSYSQETYLLNVSGSLSTLSYGKVFSPFKLIAFRLLNLLTSPHPYFSNFLKKSIRRILMYNNKSSFASFTLTLSSANGHTRLQVFTPPNKRNPILNVVACTNISERYVPQSSFFRSSDLQPAEISLNSMRIPSLENSYTYYFNIFTLL